MPGETNRILSGEFDMLVTDCGSYDAHRMQAQGAPIGHVIPADAAEITYWYLGVPKNARHPNAAKLWINYMLGREGQDVLYESDYTDHYLVPGSKAAAEVQGAAGPRLHLRPHRRAVRAAQRREGANRIREQLQTILQRKQ